MSTARRWFVICALIWVVLLPIGWWVSLQTGVGWAMTAGALNALIGSFATVVLGALLFNRWERRVEEERAAGARQEWLRRNVGYSLECHEFMLVTLGEIACEAYSLVQRGVGAGRVPEDLLRSDVTRYPSMAADSQSLVDLVSDMTRLLATGPLALARDQASTEKERLLSELMARAEDIESEPTPLTGAPLDAARLERLQYLVDRAASLTQELSDPQEFEPRELRTDGVAMLMAVQHMRLVPDHLAQLRGDQHPRVAYEIVKHAATLLGCVSRLRHRLWENAQSLILVAEESGDIVTQTKIRGRMSAINRPFRDLRWEAWRATWVKADQDRRA
jgi:hypothetical protein